MVMYTLFEDFNYKTQYSHTKLTKTTVITPHHFNHW